MCFVGLFPLIKFPQTHSRTRADAKAKLSCIASRRANISWAIRSSSYLNNDWHISLTRPQAMFYKREKWMLMNFVISINYVSINQSNNHSINDQCRFEPSQTSIFPDFTFLHILKAYIRIYQLAKFRVLILINLWIIADSNSVRTVLSPLENHRSVINHAPRACASRVSQLFS